MSCPSNTNPGSKTDRIQIQNHEKFVFGAESDFFKKNGIQIVNRIVYEKV